jgi:hypothetical protein
MKKWASAHIAPDVPGLKKRKYESQRSNRSAKRSLGNPSAHDDTLPPDTMEPI